MQVLMLRDHQLPDGRPVSNGQVVVVDEAVGHKLAKSGAAKPAFRCRVKEAGAIGLRWCDVGAVAETFTEDDRRLDYQTSVNGLKATHLGSEGGVEAGKTKTVSAVAAVDMVMAGAVEFAELPAGVTS